MKLTFSPAAQADLVDIALFIAADSVDRAYSFTQELEAACAILLHHPRIGVARPELRADLRSKPHGRYVIYYSVSASMVRIERILHGARDPGPLMTEE